MLESTARATGKAMARMLGRSPQNSTLQNPSSELIEALTGGSTGASGIPVTESSALRVATVYACVRVLSTIFAALPVHLYRVDGDKREKAKDHPLYALLHDMPNEEMSAYTVKQMMMSFINLRGTSFCEFARDGRGVIREIYPLTGQVIVDRDKAGRLVYEHHDGTGPRPVRRDRMWRVPGYSHNGITGITPLSLARETFGNAISNGQYAGSMFKNGAHFNGLLRVEQNVPDKEKRKSIRESFLEGFRGPRNAGKIPLLHNGAEFIKTSMTPVDAQFIESAKFNRTDICGFFGVPPHMVGDLERATFSNIEQQSLDFVIYSLMPYMVNYEQSIFRDLLTPEERQRYRAKTSAQALLRGDSKARAEFYRSMINNGVMTHNEARSLEDMNPAEGGDERYMQTAMGRIDENGDVTPGAKANEEQDVDQVPEPDQEEQEEPEQD
jgi:HK97 family phage portal protein